MRRLTRFHQVDAERGATAIVMALVLTVLIGFAGLAVDLGATYAKHTELQNAGDAAALALAQEFALESNACQAAKDSDKADVWREGNINTNADLARNWVDCADLQPNQLRVVSEVEQFHWFMPVVGKDRSPVSADSTVEWGRPAQGMAILPFTISICSAYHHFKSGEKPAIDQRVNLVPPQPSGKGKCGWKKDYPPGGFGWLTPTSGCGAETAIGEEVAGDTGSNVPGACSWGDFDKLIGDVVLLPVFNDSGGNGNNGWFRIHSYAAFELEGFHFNTLKGGKKSSGDACSGGSPKTCMVGTFRGYVGIDEDWIVDPSAPGEIAIIRLID